MRLTCSEVVDKAKILATKGDVMCKEFLALPAILTPQLHAKYLQMNDYLTRS